MKKIIVLLFIAIAFFVSSCKKDLVEKPKNLIDKDKMENIIYDLAILEAAKSQTMGMQTNYPKPTDFLKSKYKVDSLTFAKSTQYYASDIKEYKKMYDRIKERLKADSKKNNGGKEETLNPDAGVVK
ncbi:DUF4296 domain-containing protein [Flavobacterium sp.]|uniref:DUF4296 domain-containing protein n=1 Tax=Flavobacterium sp. TaxID=239 RepID=UPI0037518A27